MADPYSTVSITGYNSNPPADDGSAVEANRVKWSTIKTKLNDPVKTRTDDMDTALVAAFAKMIGGAGLTSTAINYTVLSTDQGKLVRATQPSITITTPDATDVDAPFVFGFLNNSTGDVTLDGSGSQTIDGDASITVPAGGGVLAFTDGSNWFTTGQNFKRPLITPQCYMTLLTVAASPLSPIPTSDQSAKTAVYVRPDGGNLLPIPDGTNFSVREFAELTLTLNSNHVASGIYDVFAFDNSGVITVGTGPVWNTVTEGSCARGTGAGTTELDLLKGLPVNKVAMTARNGATTYSVAAASAIFLGSIFIDGTAGQVTCHITAGQSRKWGISNAWNRREMELLVTDATSNWTNTPTTWRQSRADSTNFAHTFCCLGNSPSDLEFQQYIQQSVSGNNSTADIGIGYNSTTAVSGQQGRGYFESGLVGTQVTGKIHKARYRAPAALGINKVNLIEQAPSGTSNNAFWGTSAHMMGRMRFWA